MKNFFSQFVNDFYTFIYFQELTGYCPDTIYARKS